MSEKTTLKHVAKAAGVAESTVSRALAGSGQLAENTRARIIEAAIKLGYDLPSRSDAEQTGRRGVIGVVVAALHNSFYPYLVDRLHHELDDRGYDMILIIDEITGERAGRKLRNLIDTLDGVIVTTATLNSPMVDLLQRNLPTVLAIRSNMAADISLAESDNFAAGAEAMEHLLKLGHQEIGFLCGPQNTSTTQGRLDGARSALKRWGMPFSKERLFYTDFTHDGGYSGCVHLLRQTQAPTAIFCANDVIAIGALDAARKMGCRVPEDVSIIGVDDIPMASWSMIALTTVRQNIGDIGAMAAKLIIDAVEADTPAPPSHHIFPTSLVVRHTTGAAPG